MELFFRKTGEGEPLIILHGLFGSSDNWYSIGRELSGYFQVYLIDQRNHGQSPHSTLHNYDVLGEDLRKFMDNHHLQKANIIGHSMGGKTSLSLGIKYPERIIKMIVVDISPFSYPVTAPPKEYLSHERVIDGMLSVNPSQLKSREEADAKLKEFISLPAVRQFLLKNLKRTENGGFKWLLNLQALSENLSNIYSGTFDESSTNAEDLPFFPLLFIKGENSGYINASAEASIVKYFPHAEIKMIQNAGHWVHADQPAAFLSVVKDFLR